ncbi:IS200/IS605 family transposase, partial [Enterococcus faecium]
MSNDDKSLAHTRWNCKYHIVFTPKYRRKVIYGQLRKDLGKILRKLCEMKDVEIIKAHAMPDHIHMFVRVPPKISISSFMGYLKGRSAVLIHEQHANLKY